ncbi:LysR family transcriptional regulator [Amycolatopsis sp. NBC_00345]|uniref:LysR family transcriptional regulator n=1 Tax=Amycolatopsis sp. NBC_00345 TaxID=2975955 RepID=UPI002E25CAD3
MPEDPDLDLRLVRYFAVVAEHLNFGRAAAALHVAQPALSRQIQRLEHQLGARLFDRTPQGSRLTDAGRVFLPRAHDLLHTAREAALATRAAATSGALTIGYVGDLVVTPAVRELRRRHPDAEITTRHLGWQEAHALPERRVDALVTRMPLPFPDGRFRVDTLYDEPRVLVVPASHPWAGKESVTLDDLGGAELAACTSTATIWAATPGSAARPSADDSFEDKLELIADGHGVAILPAGDRRPTLREDLATIPLEGIDPCRVVVATRGTDHNPLAGDFREIARVWLAPAA